jgi:hypothetical protein
LIWAIELVVWHIIIENERGSMFWELREATQNPVDSGRYRLVLENILFCVSCFLVIVNIRLLKGLESVFLN